MNRFNFIFCYVIWQSLEYTFVKILILFFTGAVQKSHKDAKEVAIKDVIKKILKKSFHLYCFYLIGFFYNNMFVVLFSLSCMCYSRILHSYSERYNFFCNKCVLSLGQPKNWLLIFLYWPKNFEKLTFYWPIHNRLFKW